MNTTNSIRRMDFVLVNICFRFKSVKFVKRQHISRIADREVLFSYRVSFNKSGLPEHFSYFIGPIDLYRYIIPIQRVSSVSLVAKPD